MVLCYICLLCIKVRQGILNRQDSGIQNLTIKKPATKVFKVSLLVENQGRINYGAEIGDMKVCTPAVAPSMCVRGRAHVCMGVCVSVCVSGRVKLNGPLPYIWILWYRQQSTASHVLSVLCVAVSHYT